MISNRSINLGLLLLVIMAIQTAMADNSIITHKYTADPNAMVWNDRVYVFCSRDDNNGEGYDIIDYTLISSDDMVNWTDHGEVFRVPRDASWANRAYAPGSAHKNGKFYLYFPDGGSSIGVAVADRIEGPYKDAIGKALVNKSMPNCNVEWLFDPAAFVDDDGQAYLYFGGGGSTPGINLRVIKLGDNMISTVGTAVTISAPRSFEAAFMHKRNGIYYFSYSTDFNGSSARIDYMTSNNPMTGFQYKGIILDNPSVNGKNINMGNNNHASVVEFKDKWYVFYHERRVSNQVYKRSVSVDLADYNADGTMKKSACTDNGPPQIKYLNPYDTVQAETINRQSGIKTDVCSEGGIMVTSISNNDYIRVKGVDFGDGAEKFEVRAASGSSGGSIELRLGSQTGTLVGTCNITGTGGWSTWKTFECEVTNCSGVKDLYLVFKGSGEPFRLNWYRFSGPSGYLLSIQIAGKGTVSRSPNRSSFPEGTSVTLTAEPNDGWVFDSWSGDGVSGNQNPLTITMNGDKAVTAVFKRNTIDGNIVFNGDFASDADDWTFNTWSGSATGGVVNGEYRIGISSVAENSHDIQLVQSGLYLENGKTYQVAFEAYAASSRSLEINVEMDESPWTSYLPERKNFSLTTTKQEFSFVFTMEHPTDANGRIGFNAGLETPAVFIDNVKVKEFSVATVSSPAVVQSSGVKVNCSNSVLHLEFTLPENGPVSLNLYDLKGKMVKSIAVQKRSGTVYSNSFDLSGISEGSYVLKIRSQGKTIGSSKVLLVK
jgi:arabinoxylan arabinofuranohydrolase